MAEPPASPPRPAAEDAGGISRRTVEWVVAAALFVLAAAVIADNLRIGAGWGSTGPKPGYFPMRIGAIVALCALAIAWEARRTAPDRLFATWGQLKSVAQLFVPLFLYVVLIRYAGLYVSSALFIAGFMVFAGRYGWVKAAVTGIATAAVLFAIFELQFRVPLPKGPLEAWLGFA